jgi:hypothetical protein
MEWSDLKETALVAYGIQRTIFNMAIDIVRHPYLLCFYPETVNNTNFESDLHHINTTVVNQVSLIYADLTIAGLFCGLVLEEVS